MVLMTLQTRNSLFLCIVAYLHVIRHSIEPYSQAHKLLQSGLALRSLILRVSSSKTMYQIHWKCSVNAPAVPMITCSLKQNKKKIHFIDTLMLPGFMPIRTQYLPLACPYTTTRTIECEQKR